MFRTLIVGMGRAGARLHLPVLARARAKAGHRQLFAEGPFLAFDPRPPATELPGTVFAKSLADAAELAGPDRTVVHVCTPPTARVEVLTELAGLGYRKILVEKPVALQESELLHIERLRRASDLELVVVAPWLASTLTERIESIVQEAPLGRLRSISVLQRKSRFSRSMAGSGHPTAFDVEMPHAVGVALALAGGATVRGARCEDMAFGDVVIPRMGRAWLDLEHGGGTRTLIHSDMTSPARERRITLDFEQGKVIGYYASGEDDNTAQLWTRAGSLVTRVVFRDDSLSTFMARTYEQFATPGVPDRDLALHCDVVRLLAQAKAACDRPAACSVPSRPNGHATPYANGSVMLQQPSGLPV